MPEAVLEPGRIGPLWVPNRIVMGAMHLGLEGRDDDGAALAAFYARRARGGPGLIVTGGSAVSRVGAGGRSYSFVNEAGGATRLRTVAEAVHQAGGLIALQLFHAGRYAHHSSFGLEAVAPSAVHSDFSRSTPRSLDEVGILRTIEDFASGAARAREMGFDAVEVMGSEGYLINQFLSPLTNLREDAWGGDVERRMRFGLEVLRAVRARVGGDYPVLYRVSGADLVPGSSSCEESLAFAVRLGQEGVDAIEVGIGWHESRVPTVQGIVPEGAWAPIAADVRAAVRAPVAVIASNRITRLETAEAVMRETGVDFVSMARPLLADPDLIAKMQRGQGHLVNTCIACNQACVDRSFDDAATVSCMVNPVAGHELERSPDGAPPRRLRMVVIGGGPAGMEAARALAERGHRVELFEAGSELGGQFRMARLVPGKQDYGETIRYFGAELARLGVAIHLGRPVGAGDVGWLEGLDGVVLATGVRPRPIQLTGADLPHVHTYAEAFFSEPQGQDLVIIGGGGIGVDLAHWLSRPPAPISPRKHFWREQGLAEPSPGPPASGRRVTILQRSARLAAGVGRSTRWVVLQALRRQGVATLSGV
ncbi:MAG: FAD-dependent oxidoreductase, partial [Candidatus Dormibacteraceae bacterium]